MSGPVPTLQPAPEAAPAEETQTRGARVATELRRRLDQRALGSLGGELVAQLGAGLLAVVTMLILLGALGYDVGTAFNDFWQGALASSSGLEQTLVQAMPVTLTAAAVWFAYRVGMFNVGADGQLQMGGLAAFMVVTAIAGGPGIVLIVIGLVVAALAGGLWAFIAGWLRTSRNANEVISTIMLNFIAFQIGNTLVSGALEQRGATSPQTDTIAAATQMGNVVTSLPWVFVVAVAVTVALVMVMRGRRFGLRLRACGLNASAAVHSGIAVNRLRLWSFVLSGAVSGLAGGLVVLGMRHFLAFGWAPQWGFQGILIAFIALRAPILIPVWGLLFGLLSTSAPLLKADVGVPDGLVSVMQVLPALAIFVLHTAARRFTHRGAI
jgi:simple sugar transport system permease protein